MTDLRKGFGFVHSAIRVVTQSHGGWKSTSQASLSDIVDAGNGFYQTVIDPERAFLAFPALISPQEVRTESTAKKYAWDCFEPILDE